jgi:hypothetical protein
MANGARAGRPGRGWLLAGAILILITATLHTIGQLGPTPPGFEAAISAMQQARLDMGFAMTPSLFDILQDLTFTMSLAFYALGALNLLLARSAEVTQRLQRQVALINLIWIGAFIVLCAYYRIPPPLICGVVMWPVFLMAYVRSR